MQTVKVYTYLQCDFAAVMPDDSMINKGIYAGDVVGFVACDHVENGQIAAVKVGDKLFVRTVWADGRQLVAANTAYMTELFSADELLGVQIIGKAVEVWRSLTPAGSPERPLPPNDPQGVLV